MVDMLPAVRSTRLIKAFRTDKLLFRHRWLNYVGNVSWMRSIKRHQPLKETKHPGMWFTSLQFIGHAMFTTTQPSETPPLRIYLTNWQHSFSFILLPRMPMWVPEQQRKKLQDGQEGTSWFVLFIKHYLDDQMKVKIGGACKMNGTNYGSRSIAVGIEARLLAGISWVRTPAGDFFTTRSRSALGSTQPPVHWVPKLFRVNEPAEVSCWPLTSN